MEVFKKVFGYDTLGYFRLWVKAKKDENGKIIIPPGHTDKIPPTVGQGVRLRFVDGEWIQELVTEAQKIEYEQKIKAEIRRWAISNLIAFEEIPIGYV